MGDLLKVFNESSLDMAGPVFVPSGEQHVENVAINLGDGNPDTGWPNYDDEPDTHFIASIADDSVTDVTIDDNNYNGAAAGGDVTFTPTYENDEGRTRTLIMQVYDIESAIIDDNPLRVGRDYTAFGTKQVFLGVPYLTLTADTTTYIKDVTHPTLTVKAVDEDGVELDGFDKDIELLLTHDSLEWSDTVSLVDGTGDIEFALVPNDDAITSDTEGSVGGYNNNYGMISNDLGITFRTAVAPNCPYCSPNPFEAIITLTNWTFDITATSKSIDLSGSYTCDFWTNVSNSCFYSFKATNAFTDYGADPLYEYTVLIELQSTGNHRVWTEVREKATPSNTGIVVFDSDSPSTPGCIDFSGGTVIYAGGSTGYSNLNGSATFSTDFVF